MSTLPIFHDKYSTVKNLSFSTSMFAIKNLLKMPYKNKQIKLGVASIEVATTVTTPPLGNQFVLKGLACLNKVLPYLTLPYLTLMTICILD